MTESCGHDFRAFFVDRSEFGSYRVDSSSYMRALMTTMFVL